MIGKDEKSGSNYKSEKLKIKDHTDINPIPKKRRLIRCSNCNEHGHKTIRFSQAIASTKVCADEKKKKEVEEMKKKYVKKLENKSHYVIIVREKLSVNQINQIFY